MRECKREQTNATLQPNQRWFTAGSVCEVLRPLSELLCLHALICFVSGTHKNIVKKKKNRYELYTVGSGGSVSLPRLIAVLTSLLRFFVSTFLIGHLCIHCTV